MFEKTIVMPTEGQFIAVWEFGSRIWSETFMWEGGKLFHYINGEEHSDGNEWEAVPSILSEGFYNCQENEETPNLRPGTYFLTFLGKETDDE